MKIRGRLLFVAPLVLAVATLTACGGGGSGGSSVPSIGEDDGGAGGGDDFGGGESGGGGSATSFELLDPTPGRDDNFGSQVLILDNGNIVVADPGDSSIAANNGAVHLYNSVTKALIGSIYGDQASDRLGGNGITAVGNNFIINSAQDHNGALTQAGSVRLINGSTGVQMGALVGDQARDQIGSNGVLVLANGNYVVSSAYDDNAAVQDAGSVRLMNGSTGTEIRALVGSERQALGRHGVTALRNSNFTIQSFIDDNGLVSRAGSVRLVNGSSGESIQVLRGEQTNSMLGNGSVTALANNNYVVSSADDHDGSGVLGGSVRLMNGATGAQISVLFGDANGDFFSNEILALDNNNYVILSPNDNHEAIRDAGAVRLMNGSTGDQINVFYGDQTDDTLGQRRRFFGSSGPSGTALNNSNFVVASSFDDSPSIVNAGSVRIFSGSTGAQIDLLYGDAPEDQLGSEGVTALANSHYVIASNFDDNGAAENAGSVRLMNGTTGAAIGTALFGDQSDDRLASETHSIRALANNNYVISSPYDDDGAIENAGSVRLMNGQTGEQISALIGDQRNDYIGIDRLRGAAGVTTLGNDRYAILAHQDDDSTSGVVNSGSVRLMDGANGTQLSSFVGTSIADMSSGTYDATITAASDGSYIVLAAPMWDNNGRSNAGLVRLITP